MQEIVLSTEKVVIMRCFFDGTRHMEMVVRVETDKDLEQHFANIKANWPGLTFTHFTTEQWKENK